MSSTVASIAARERSTFGLHHGDGVVIAAMVLGAVVFYLSPWPVIYLLALAGVAVLTWYRLDLALVLVILFAPLYMQPKHLGAKEFAPSEILLVLDVVVAALWSVWPSEQRSLHWAELRRSPFLAPALLFLSASAVSTLLAADRHHALRYFILWVVEPEIFFGLLVLSVRSRAQWRLLLAAVVATGLWVGFVALVQYLTHHDLTDAGSALPKVHSVYGSPDNVGLLFDRVFGVWLVAGLAVPLAKRWRVLWLVAGGVLAAALILSYSRGAWLAVAITALAVLFVTRHWRKWMVPAALVVLVIAAAVGGNRLAVALRSGHQGTVQFRLFLWREAGSIAVAHPVFGIGPDNFLHYFAPTKKLDPYIKYCPFGLDNSPESGQQPCTSHPHDEILDFWLSAGVLGLAAFVWLQGVFWHLCLSAYRRRQEEQAAWPITFACGAAMLAALIHGLVDNGYFLVDLALLFWLLCGCVSFVTARPADNGRAEVASATAGGV